MKKLRQDLALLTMNICALGLLRGWWKTTRDMWRSSSGIIDEVRTVIIAAIFILVGILVYSQVESAIPRPSQQTLNDTVNSSIATTTSAFNLLVVSLIIVAAAAIIAILFRALGGAFGRRGE